MHTASTPPKNRIEGVAFDIPELILLSAWSDFHAFRMSVELDWHVDHVEYEEVVTLRHPDRPGLYCLLWRTTEDIVLQPMVGRARRFGTISDALAAICPEQV